MAATLTERYIGVVTKPLNPTAQDDVRIELEASIADAVEARVEQGEGQTDAERAVLTELGDPAILAASYSDRPLHLIGPRFFACLALTIVIALGVLRADRWTFLLASLNAVIALVILVASVALIWQNGLLHPDLTTFWAGASAGVQTGVNVALTLVFGASVISAIPEPFVKAMRTRRV